MGDISLSSGINSKTSCIAWLKTMYSASVVLKEISVWSLLHKSTGQPAYIMTYTLRDITFYALSVSACAHPPERGHEQNTWHPFLCPICTLYRGWITIRIRQEGQHIVRYLLGTLWCVWQRACAWAVVCCWTVSAHPKELISSWRMHIHIYIYIH